MNCFNFDKNNIKRTIDIAWPAILESFFVAFAGLVDSLMVSRLGSSAVAAVGLTTQPKFVGLSLFIAGNVAISALVARRRGEKNKDDANNIFATYLTFAIIMAAILSVVIVLFASPIIRLCGSSPDTHEQAVIYFRIIMGGMIFNVILMGINSAQRGAGNTRITMKTNIVSNALNVLFNYLLIEGHFGFPALGIHGAAIATVLGTVVGSIMSIRSVLPEDSFVSITYIVKNKIFPTFRSLISIFKVAYSVFIEQLLMRIGFMLTAIMAADQGTHAMAAHQVGMNIMALSFSFGDGLQSAAVALIGRSLGEKNPELAKEYGKICRVFGSLISIVLACIYFFGGAFLYGLFFKEPEIIEIGVSIMRVMIFIVLIQIPQVIYMGCLRGAGDTLFTAIVSTIGVTIMRTAVSYVGGYVLGWGIVGIWLGVIGDQLTRFVCVSIRFKRGKWVNIKI